MDGVVHTFELIRFQDLTPHVRLFECRLVGENRFEFRAGQFISMEFSLDNQTFTRSYSVASPPRDDNYLELLARFNQGGPGTRYLWSLEPGVRLSLSGPFGSFLLREPEPRDSLFVAIGTGIAPVRSMLHSVLGERPRSEFRLLYGVRDQTDLLYHAEFLELARRHSNFSYSVVLSRPLNGWNGHAGRVQEHIVDALAGRKNLDVYLSGSQEMVADIQRILEQLGLDSNSIYHEKYG